MACEHRQRQVDSGPAGFIDLKTAGLTMCAVHAQNGRALSGCCACRNVVRSAATSKMKEVRARQLTRRRKPVTVTFGVWNRALVYG